MKQLRLCLMALAACGLLAAAACSSDTPTAPRRTGPAVTDPIPNPLQPATCDSTVSESTCKNGGTVGSGN